MEKAISPIISPDDVRFLLGRDDVVIVDARGGFDAMDRYRSAHLQSAVPVSLESDLSCIGDPSDGGRHPLPDAQHFGHLLGKLRIEAASRVFVYDDKAGANAAARFWWMMRAVGHKNVQVIDGGLGAAQQAGLPVASGMPEGRNESAPPYPATAWILPLADIELINTMRTDESALVIDVRESYRYRGDSEPIDLVAGHIPGAINVPYLDNLGPEGQFRSPQELADRFSDVIGHKHPRQIAVHCGSGVTACHTLLAMEVAGIPMPRLYIGSWSEWSRNERPIAKGVTPDGV